MLVLGCGFLKKLNRTALATELRALGPDVVQVARITVYYHAGGLTGVFAGAFVGSPVIAQLKAVKR